MFQTTPRYRQIIERIDAANAADPHHATDPASGATVASEVLYGQRMSAMLARYAPDASEAVHVAVRAQHIQRWQIPRSDYPQTTFGYKQWRAHLARFHAETTATLMHEAGYDEDMIQRTRAIVGKLGIKVNPESQLLEDVASLVFFTHYLNDFMARHPEYDAPKWQGILHKTWQKMSHRAHAYVLNHIPLPFDPAAYGLTVATEPPPPPAPAST